MKLIDYLALAIVFTACGESNTCEDRMGYRPVNGGVELWPNGEFAGAILRSDISCAEVESTLNTWNEFVEAAEPEEAWVREILREKHIWLFFPDSEQYPNDQVVRLLPWRDELLYIFVRFRDTEPRVIVERGAIQRFPPRESDRP